MKYKENTQVNKEIVENETVENEIENKTVSTLLDLLSFITEQQHSYCLCDKTISTLTKIRKAIIEIMYFNNENFTYPEIKATKVLPLDLNEIIKMFYNVSNKISEAITVAKNNKEWYVATVLDETLYDLNEEIISLKKKNDK